MDTIYRGLDVIKTDGEHLILYGDRGVGKTSIARVLGGVAQDIERDRNLRVLFVSCSSSDDFRSIWRKVVEEVQVTERQAGFGAHMTMPRPMTLDDQMVDPNDVRRLVQSFSNPTVIVIDEFDRVPVANDARRLMADTIKLFSDNALPSTIVIVGVAGSIEELIAEHHSITRHAAQLEVKPMTLDALAVVVQKGFELAGMTYDAGVDKRIAEMSQGYPHYTHLLGLWSGRRATRASRTHVSIADLDAAVNDALENATGDIRQAYDRAVQSAQPRTLYREVLLACALAKKDAFGRFRTSDVGPPLRQITGRPYEVAAFQSHLSKFTEGDRGPALRRTGNPHGYRWQFVNPQLIPYVRLEGVREGRIGT
ncbi:MAG: ATP-binding protein [Chloroflexi bacterium]|nr:ATP-binding protein [Chloroflexota bacterium]